MGLKRQLEFLKDTQYSRVEGITVDLYSTIPVCDRFGRKTIEILLGKEEPIFEFDGKEYMSPIQKVHNSGSNVWIFQWSKKDESYARYYIKQHFPTHLKIWTGEEKQDIIVEMPLQKSPIKETKTSEQHAARVSEKGDTATTYTESTKQTGDRESSQAMSSITHSLSPPAPPKSPVNQANTAHQPVRWPNHYSHNAGPYYGALHYQRHESNIPYNENWQNSEQTTYEFCGRF